MGFVELAKQFAYNFTFEEFKNQIELKVLYNVILGIILKFYIHHKLLEIYFLF